MEQLFELYVSLFFVTIEHLFEAIVHFPCDVLQ